MADTTRFDCRFLNRKCFYPTQFEGKTSPNKMPAYAPKGVSKINPEKGHRLGGSKLGKLVAKNANRSLKRIVRQKAKQDIYESLLENE